MSIITGLISNVFFLIFAIFCALVVWNGNHIVLLPGWAWLIYLGSMIVSVCLKPFRFRILGLFLLPFLVVVFLGLLGQGAAGDARKVNLIWLNLLDLERFLVWASMIVIAPGWTIYALGRSFGGKDLRILERLKRRT